MSSGNPIIIGRVSPFPIGTLQEIQKEGYDAREWPCCHEPQPGVIRGCNLASKCLFHLRKMGGFKFTGGPKNVVYRLVTDKVENSNAKEGYCSCIAFTEVFQDRMLSGLNLRQQGKDGEIIAVIGGEGDEYIERVERSVRNAQGQIVDWEVKTIKKVCPSFPRPGQVSELNYSQMIIQREQERQRLEDDLESAAYEQVRRKQMADLEDDDTLEIGNKKP